MKNSCGLFLDQQTVMLKSHLGAHCPRVDVLMLAYAKIHSGNSLQLWRLHGWCWGWACQGHAGYLHSNKHPTTHTPGSYSVDGSRTFLKNSSKTIFTGDSLGPLALHFGNGESLFLSGFQVGFYFLLSPLYEAASFYKGIATREKRKSSQNFMLITTSEL